MDTTRYGMSTLEWSPMSCCRFFQGLQDFARSERHGIAGWSSGAIAAFTVAWERPDVFHKVLNGIGTCQFEGRTCLSEDPREREETAAHFMIDGRNDNRGLNDKASTIRPATGFSERQDGAGAHEGLRRELFVGNQAYTATIWAAPCCPK
jgi:S-formylglutathione hydrolase FrmB